MTSHKLTREAKKLAREQGIPLSVAKRMILAGEASSTSPTQWNRIQQCMIPSLRGEVSLDDGVKQGGLATTILKHHFFDALDSALRGRVNVIFLDFAQSESSSRFSSSISPSVKVGAYNLSDSIAALEGAIKNAEPLHLSVDRQSDLDALVRGARTKFDRPLTSVVFIAGAARINDRSISNFRDNFLIRGAREFTPLVFLDEAPTWTDQYNEGPAAIQPDLRWDNGSGSVDMSETPHVLIIGRSGIGKTHMVRSAIDQLVANNKRSQIAIKVVDLDGDLADLRSTDQDLEVHSGIGLADMVPAVTGVTDSISDSVHTVVVIDALSTVDRFLERTQVESDISEAVATTIQSLLERDNVSLVLTSTTPQPRALWDHRHRFNIIQWGRPELSWSPDEKNRPANLIVTGPAGTGKSMSAYTLMSQLREAEGDNCRIWLASSAPVPDRVLSLCEPGKTVITGGDDTNEEFLNRLAGLVESLIEELDNRDSSSPRIMLVVDDGVMSASTRPDSPATVRNIAENLLLIAKSARESRVSLIAVQRHWPPSIITDHPELFRKVQMYGPGGGRYEGSFRDGDSFRVVPLDYSQT